MQVASNRSTPPDEITGMSATALRQAIAGKEVSPVELLEACIARITALNPFVNAITATCFDRARQEARRAEAAVRAGEPLGALHGLPLGVKDTEETEGLLTTYGSPLWRENIPRQDSAFVRRLRKAGAIVVAKTNVPEFAAGGVTRNAVWGATGNPFDPLLNCGGSSGGSAVALATQMLPLCTGTDMGGSLRIPAALCGVTALRPSPGLVPSDRRDMGWLPATVGGPLGRTIDDVGLQLSASVGLDDLDPLSYEIEAARFANLNHADLAGLRVGWTEDFGLCDVDAGIRQTFRSRIAAMRHLFRLCEEVRPDVRCAHQCFDALRGASFVARHRAAYEKNPHDLGDEVRTNYEMGLKLTLGEHAAAHQEQTRMFRAFQPLLREYDIILAPTSPVSPFPWSQPGPGEVQGRPQENYYRWLALTYVVTLLTNPTLALPCGLDHKAMPFGLQVIGGFRQDLRLLEIGKSLEWAWARIDGLQRPQPDTARLGSAPAADFKAMVKFAPTGTTA